MEIKQLVETELREDFKGLRDEELGSETFKTAVDGMTKLIDRSIEIEKLEQAKQEQEFERELKLKQARDERIDRWVKNGLTAAGLIVSTTITIWGTLKSLKFEETGTVTTMAGRGFINKIFSKK